MARKLVLSSGRDLSAGAGADEILDSLEAGLRWTPFLPFA